MELKINELNKTYPNGTKALDNISLIIRPGMFGLLGPNGAGKSTLMRTIATLQESDSGQIVFDDFDISHDKIRLRKKLGYLPQEFGVYPRMSAIKLLDYFAQLKGASHKKQRRELIDYALEVTNLSDVAHKAVHGFSGGMKRRFGIAQLLLNDPDLIIVDEPTAGLDPAERRRFLNVLREIGRENIVIFSTHIVEDIKDLCIDMAVMKKGRILDHIPPKDAIKRVEGKIYERKILEDQKEEAEQTYHILSSQYHDNQTLKIRVYSDVSLTMPFESVPATLEDYYFFILKDKYV